MGDPAGIGPEVIVKALADKQVRSKIQPLIIGDATCIEKITRQLKQDSRVVTVGELSHKPVKATDLPVLQLPGNTRKVKPGKWTNYSGQLSYDAVVCVTELAKQKEVDAVVTAPICKEAWQAAGIHYHGHTELLADLCKTKQFAMMFTGGPFKLMLATIHTPLVNVSKLLTKTLIKRMVTLGAVELKNRFGIMKPHIAVAGFNPHAGEHGMFGKEEIKTIIPAIKEVKKSRSMKISGPYPPDTLFAEAVTGKFDLVLCMYHDQGLIPFKMLALHEGVNVTAGLPIIRTSPDHGTAFDRAGKGTANPGSMIAALLTAAEMVKKSKK